MNNKEKCKSITLIKELNNYFEKYGTGHENRIKISELEARFNSSNRKIRMAIHGLKELNIPIIPDTESGGYFLARINNEVDQPFVDAYRKAERSRCLSSWTGYKVTNQFYPVNQINFDEVNIKINEFLNKCDRWCNDTIALTY